MVGRLVLPSPWLRPWVRYYAFGCLPSGICHFPADPGAALHFVLDGGVGPTTAQDDTVPSLPTLSVSGPIAGPVAGRAIEGTRYLAVALMPGAWTDLVPAAPGELSNNLVHGDDLWRREMAMLPERMSEAGDVEVIETVEATLGRRLLTAPRRSHGGFSQKESWWIGRSLRTMAPGEVAREMGLSTRQFQRRFRRQFGYSPKRYQRYSRMLGMIQALRSGNIKAHNLADLAAEFGYYDQSHLVREFKAFVGLSPTVLAERLAAGDPSLWAYRLPGASVSI